MRNKKILTIDDLINFCQSNNFTKFSSSESGYALYVQVPCEDFELETKEDPMTLYANVRLAHTGPNRNHSSLTEKAAKRCLSTIAYKPILADFTEVNGEKDFTYHAIEYNDDGSRTYIERQVGCFTSDKAYMKQDPDNPDRMYIFARAAIPREYTDTAEIIERKGGTKISAELLINDMSYSIDEGLMLEDVEVMGATLLGVDPESGETVLEGMENAYLQIEDFSAENNSVIDKQNLINEITSAVITQLSNKQAEYAEAKTTEGGETKVGNDENINVEFDETETDEEIKVTETESEEVETTEEEEETPVVETESSNEENEDDETPPEVVEEFEDEPEEEEETDDEESDEDTHQGTSVKEDEDSAGTRVENSLTYSVTINGVTKEFSVSLNEKINAITLLVNETYGEVDNTYYDCEVYEDDGKYCVMHDWWGNRHFKQEFSVKKDVYQLKGDRVIVKMRFLTDLEIAQLDKMKSDFSAMESELNAYKSAELHTQRESVLASEEYSVMADFAEFTELKNNMDNYSVEDLTKEADLLYAKFMKSNYSTFAAKEQPKKRSMVFMSSGENTQEEKLPYGGLFKNFKGKK